VVMAKIEKLAKLLPAVSRNPLKSPKQQPVVARQQTNKQGGKMVKWGVGQDTFRPCDPRPIDDVVNGKNLNTLSHTQRDRDGDLSGDSARKRGPESNNGA